MVVPAEVAVELYDRAFNRVGWLNDHTSLVASYRHNRRGSATVTVPADHVRAAALFAAGCRAVITYTPDGGAPMHLSGLVGAVQGQGPRGASSVVATILGDWVDGVLAWPVPAAALSAQSAAYWTATGPAETVLKSLITANGVTRLGRPWTVATNLARGSSVKVSARMVPLSDVVEPAADAGGIGLRMAQVPGTATIGVDCYESVDRLDRVLSEDTGALASWSLTTNAPTATDLVIGLDGEAAAREFVAATNATDAAAWGGVEAFLDARDLSAGADGVARGNAALLGELAASYSITATLTETATWRAGVTVGLGDRVVVSPFPGMSWTERVREITVTSTAAEGVLATPVVGNPDQSTPARANAARVAAIARAVRNLRAR